ncbi:hypothetical protein HY500_04370 [Candidatus Woesearchaeota archaeon]|nr:hypothetical protein [Candidatus Woesearchaeota archaeon]
MYTIVLDTNFLITALKFKIDLFEEIEKICIFDYKLSVLDRTLDELRGKPDEKLIKALIHKKEVDIIKTNTKNYVDDILAGVDKNFIIATQDIGLKRRLQLKKIPVIFIRQKKYLELKNVL